MATVEATQNGASVLNGSNGELSAAQKLMQQHAVDESHKATVEEVPDEEDLKHGVLSNSTSEPSPDTKPPPTWASPASSKAAGKQKAQETPSQPNKPSLDTQSHDLFPGLGGVPKSQPTPTVVPIWGTKKTAAAVVPNGKTNESNGTESKPTSGVVTLTPAVSRGPAIVIPGRHQERISLSQEQILPRNLLKRPIIDVVKDINKKSKATVAMTTGERGLLWFNAVGSYEACKAALLDLCQQIGSKVRGRFSFI